ncbi:thiolase family protein [Pusillimonas sp. SM2304]|uniref:thiolase family protein n=1 Tax=Pusillimonas sp. SM2304 TaxID=3073241 RepID=UPI0028744D15|nr:thiolase family protein [Pusillimonas sp. SM2304]MDS1140085.1 thiolase family protein [Pusillimonas sp. SM2304]
MSVYITGIGHTPLGRHPELSVKQLTAQAVNLALADGGYALDDVQAAWFSNVRQGQMERQNSIRGQCALHAMGFSGIPVFNIENACASSSSGLFNAYLAIASGMFDTVLVVGTEKMFYPEKKTEMMNAFFGGTDIHLLKETWDFFCDLETDPEIRERLNSPGAWNTQSFFMDIYAAMARQHMRMYGTTQAQIACAAAKNHRHSTMNPLAQYQKDMSVQDVLESPEIAWPLTRAMCAPISDGAAAVVLSSERALTAGNRGRAIRIQGMGVSSTVHRDVLDMDQHCVSLAARRAYQMAGIAPEQIDVVEVHDASSFAEVLQIENLGLCARGQGGPHTEAGHTSLGGRTPVNVSGGLVSKGHPIAATGLVQMHELVMQLRHEAGARQVAGARIAVAENGGGFLKHEDAAAVVTVLSNKRD